MGFRRVSEYVCESVCGKTAAHVEKVGEEKEMSGRQGERRRRSSWMWESERKKERQRGS